MDYEQETLGKRDAIKYLRIQDKEFDNYHKSSGEIQGEKIGGRFRFNKIKLSKWLDNKKNRTVMLSLKEYEKCFEFAIKMVYSGKTSHGTGIRGVRSEVQMADDFILGILAEHGVKKFLKEKFNVDINLDLEVHPDRITQQDFDGIYENGKLRKVRLGVAVKSSKWKNCWNIIAPIEYESSERRSDIYIFARVGLPSDHLFRILREHSFFKNVKDILDKSNGFKKILELEEIPIWITGFSYHGEFERVTEIPGQKFTGNPNYRYVKSVAKMHNSDQDWENLIKKL